MVALDQSSRDRSPLTQGRGLKHKIHRLVYHQLPSPLTQGRGLKHHFADTLELYKDVAPHTGAWIETSTSLITPSSSRSPLTQGRGLKHH